MRRLFPIALLVPCMGFSIMGCSAQKNGGSAVPSDFSVSIGEGGGVTGQWRGYAVAADGAVTEWHGQGAQKHAHDVGRISPEERRALWEHVGASALMEQDRTERGNMTRSVTIVAGGQTRELTWAVTIPPGKDDPLERFYSVCQTTLASARPGG